MFVMGATYDSGSDGISSIVIVILCVVAIVSLFSLVLLLRWISRIKELVGLLGKIEADKQKPHVGNTSGPASAPPDGKAKAWKEPAV